MEPNTNNATTVMTKLVTLIESVMGNSESSKTKMLLHLVATVLGSIAEEGETLLSDKFDTNALLAGILRVENGLTDVEDGVKDVMAALKEKKPTAAQVGSAV
ncbi:MULTISPECIES: hypothetical protein [unclassified Saccharibacter]|uniref:hypothetical protein n=1 Tax=unclassified Saccharibacter TaxID=2648722 RepID=UPI0013250ED4|nr:MULTISPECIES: hypothetical protein [unclassified Saccharibacter]MXV35879.1 hypothetical protein [Saccharibacter sp. EH611]MXV57999.1 hypothetical protein [Saccharibacter sp. EH70]MXV66237.1 hypothetical protein [Saccharibacter sp. EH60]MXV66394.1 hypothetical protein [Saccharibacter sp. EH60]